MLTQQNISNGNTNHSQIGTINDENVQVLFARMSSQIQVWVKDILVLLKKVIKKERTN